MGCLCLPIQRIRDQGNYPLDRKYLCERERQYFTASWTFVYEASLLICPLCLFEKEEGDLQINGNRCSRWAKSGGQYNGGA